LLPVLALMAGLGSLSGCGKSDPNKDLKPVSKDTPMPKAAGGGPSAPGQGPGQGASVSAPGGVAK